MSTIYVNGLTRTYNQFLKNQEAKKAPDGYREDSFQEKLAGIGHAEEAENSAEDCIAIHISEEGFAAMKNDPEYEKWVLDGIRQDFGFHNPWSAYCGGNYCVKYFGATKEEYHGESWSADYQNGNGKRLYEKKAKDSYWERRLAQKKRMKKWIKKQQEKKRLQEAAFEKEARKKRAVHQKQLEKFLRDERLDAHDFPGEDHEMRKAAQALASYELSLLMMDFKG